MSRRRSLLFGWTAAGIACGLTFPLAGWILAAGGIWPSQVVSAHQLQPVLWIVDLAPLVLGITGGLIGFQIGRVDDAHRRAEDLVLTRTSQLQEANAQLEQLIRSKDEFVATISHELRTPLTAVLGFALELQQADGRLDPEEQKELLDLIASQSKEVADIINDLLVAARADIGKVAVIDIELELADHVEQALQAFMQPSRRKLEIVPELAPARVVADPTRIRQIVRNLLTNAERYGGDRVEVLTGVLGGEGMLVVADNGPGIAEVDREAIFDPYHRTLGSGSTPGSVGLGLTVSRKLARLMGGDLTYRYEHRMSMFVLTLPLVPSPEPAEQPQSTLAANL